MFNMKQVGKKIVSLRKSRNMTQTELADKMDVSFQAVSNWERGNSMPDISKLPQLAALFDCTVDELLDGRVELLHSAMEDGIQEYVEHNEVSKEELEAAVPILKPEQVEQLADSMLLKNGDHIEAFYPYLDDETLRALWDLAAQDERVQDVIDRCQDYPEDLLKMLSRNLDMLDFVLEYPEKQGQVFAGTIGDVKTGEIPLLLQYDQRWGYGAYGASSVVVSGCGPACLSMVAAGLTGDNTITPYAVAQYADQEGYYVYGAGTAWSLMSRGAARFGVEGEELPLMKSRMESALREGRPIICVVGPGDFTTSGHFIVITGMRDGQFTVNDPNSTERSNLLWDYETLEPQISNLWAFRTV